MIPNYVRPQLTIKQLLDRTPSASVSRINAIAVGPQYLLSRYGQETTQAFPYNAAGTSIPLSYYTTLGTWAALTNEVVDATSLKLYGSGLEVVLGAPDVVVPDVTAPNIVSADSGDLFASDDMGDLVDELNARNVIVGDVIYITGADKVRRRTVIGLLGAPVASSFGTNPSKNDGKVANSSYNATSGTTAAFTSVSSPSGHTLTCVSAAAFNTRDNFNKGPRYNGAFGDRLTITVVTGGAPGVATYSVTSDSGLYSLGVQTTTNVGTNIFGFSIASLAIRSTTSGDLVAGQRYVFTIVGTYTRIGNTSAPAILAAGTYAGEKDTTYIIQITATNTSADNPTGAVLRISDTAGVEPAVVDVTITADNTPVSMGTGGLTVAIDLAVSSGYLLVGETFYVHAVAATQSTTLFDRLVLDGPAIDTSLAYAGAAMGTQIVTAFNGYIETGDEADGSAWAIADNTITVEPTLMTFVTYNTGVTGWAAFKDGVGSLHASFRALVPPAYGESVIAIDSTSDITDQLGTIDIDNDLAFGAAQVLAGAQGQRIYALRVSEDSAEGFAAAFLKVEATDMVYSFAILSEKEEVKQAAKTHVLAMSTSEQKKFRRAYVGTDSPGDYIKASADSNGANILATMTGPGYKTLSTDSPGVSFVSMGLVKGDKIEHDGTFYLVDSVTSASELVLQSGPDHAVFPAQAVVVWKADTPESQAAYVKSISAGLGTRRVANVWVEDGRKILSGTTATAIPCRFIAAEIAGLRSAVLPQQGLTRTQITSITEASQMHTRYTQSLLDEVAAAGTFVITQDVESGSVYIRHQLTTETDKGSLYYEDSIGVNLDNISFAIKDLLEEYIGKYNVNAATISEIRNRVHQLLTDYTMTSVGTSIGPALIGFEDLVVEADAILKDRINVSATLFMPLPLNNIEVTLQGSVDLTL